MKFYHYLELQYFKYLIRHGHLGYAFHVDYSSNQLFLQRAVHKSFSRCESFIFVSVFVTKMENLIKNYFALFVEFKYHGVMYKQQCVEKCSSLLSGLPTVSQLDRFSQMVADKEDWIELCDPTRTFQEQRGTRKKGSCSIFLDANYDWNSRTWRSKYVTIDDSFWLRKNNQTKIVPAMPIMS